MLCANRAWEFHVAPLKAPENGIVAGGSGARNACSAEKPGGGGGGGGGTGSIGGSDGGGVSVAEQGN